MDDFQSLEHLAYLEHTEYRAPTRNIGWGEEEEDKEILRQIFDELEITTKLASNSEDEDLTESTNNMLTDEHTTSGAFEDLAEDTNGKSRTSGSSTSAGSEMGGKSTSASEGSEMPIRSTGSSFNSWQGRVHFVTKEPPSRIDDRKEDDEEPTQPISVTNNDPWRIRFEVQRPKSNGNQPVGSPEFEVTTDPKFGGPEFEVTDRNTGKDTSSTFPSSIEIFETMPPCDTEFCE